MLLGTGGGVIKALPELGAAPFYHLNSDTLWIDGVKPNLARLADAFDPASMDALLLLAPTTGSIGYAGRGDFVMAGDGRLPARGEREVAPFVYAGAAILSPALFADPPQHEFPLTDLFDRAAEARPPARPAAGRPVDACRHARRHRLGGSRDRGPAPVDRRRALSVYDSPMPASRPNIFNIPASAPFLRTLIDALLAGKLVPGFPEKGDPLALSRATLYLPTRRACRLARDVFLDALDGGAAILPRIVPLGDIDEDEIAFAEAAAGDPAQASLALPPALGGLERAMPLAALILTLGADALRRARAASAPLVANNPATAFGAGAATWRG